MMTERKHHKTLPFPAARKVIVDFGYLAARRHIASAFVEIDVTHARAIMRAHKASKGETLSFTAYVIHCLGAAVQAHLLVQAYRDWRGRLIVFDAVDVSTLIEIERDAAAVPHVLRAVNRKSVYELHREIRAVQAGRLQSPQQVDHTNWLLRLPRWMRLIGMRLAMRNPHLVKRLAGTVVVTSVGMFGGGAGWGVGFLAMHTLGITVGGIAQRPAIVQGQLCNREFLCMTISFDHDVVDGAAIARFVHSFRMQLESGAGLADLA